MTDGGSKEGFLYFVHSLKQAGQILLIRFVVETCLEVLVNQVIDWGCAFDWLDERLLWYPLRSLRNQELPQELHYLLGYSNLKSFSIVWWANTLKLLLLLIPNLFPEKVFNKVLVIRLVQTVLICESLLNLLHWRVLLVKIGRLIHVVAILLDMESSHQLLKHQLLLSMYMPDFSRWFNFGQ